MLNRRVEEESAAKIAAQKQVREVEGQKQEVVEDLESERDARTRAEKHRRDLSEVNYRLLYVDAACNCHTSPARLNE